MRKMLAVAASIVLLTIAMYPQCGSKQDYRLEKKGGIVVEHVELRGTRAMDSTQLGEVSGYFVGSCFNENAGEIGERIRDQFQQRGYYKAKVENVSIKARDPLALPKPVTVEAEVTEGPLYRLSRLDFVGNRAFTSEQLAAQFTLKTGDPFRTNTVRSGLAALRKLYGSQGYLDFKAIPMPEPNSEAAVALKISVEEGKQYRMGKLEIAGEKEKSDLLATKWSLPEGAPFDASYVDKFVDENKSLLPEGFQQRNSIRVVRNCRERTVAVYVALDKKGSSEAVNEIGCDEEQN